MKLCTPSEEWEAEHQAYWEEWGEEAMIPTSFDLTGYDNYHTYLQDLASKQKGEGNWVPNSNYFLVNENERIVAMINIRHELNDFLWKIGGHIGYGVRPSERRKGYATRILREALAVCQELKIEHVLVTCEASNIGSAKTIINNGGIEDEPYKDRDGKKTRRFWIRNK